MMKANRAVYTLAIFCVAVLSTPVLRAQAQKEAAIPQEGAQAVHIPPSSAPSTPPQLTSADLEAYLNGMMPAQLAREDVAGAVIAVVKDGHVLFAKGYGFSDVVKRTPVTPDSTLFRPGSISKLFTWTAVMQLVEQGKLDLDKDINEYLDFKIPPAFGKPVTLRNTMTHTAGFEEIAKDLFVADAQHMQNLERYLKQHTPERIFPPGVVPAYSNYAVAMAGYIVQRVSGKPFEQYVAENIFIPLDMKRTTFVQPLPEDMKSMMSTGYTKASAKPKSFEFVEAFPAGSVSTTAKDMSNFMIAHLQDGKFGDKQILRPETAKLMHSRVFGSDDRLSGMAHGFYEESRNGHRIIGHGGDTQYFHSDLHLIPDANVGFFVSYNSAGKGEVSPRSILFEGFLDRYFPFTPPAPEKIADSKADAAAISGLYKVSRRAESSFLRLLTLVGEAKVFANPDGTISVDPLKGANGELRKFEEISPFLYREVNDQNHVAFKKDSNGEWQFQLDWPIFIFQKASFQENKYFNYSFLFFGLGVVLLTILLWPVAAMIRKHYGRPLGLNPSERRSRLISRFVCILFLALFVGWLTVLSLADDPAGLNSIGPWVIAFGILGVLCLIGTLFVCVNAFRSCRTSGRWIWAKLHDVLLALACLSLAWFVFTWNLMNFNTHY
jgi:CubicO group peptidase (beta-lactamase class C family)